jgi:hypothetical protein
MDLTNSYWDVFPKSIRLSTSAIQQRVPLSVCGNLSTPLFESTNPSIVSVDQNGVISCGSRAGAAMVLVFSDEDRESLRHVAVELRNPSWFSDHPDFRMGAAVHLTGRVIDALNTNAIDQARIILRQSDSGPVTHDLLTNGAGVYEVDLTEGYYIYEVSHEGYITAHGGFSVSQNNASNSDIVLSPLLQGQVGRIVLTWGESPWDLDSHLVGPLADGTRFHVWYGNKVVPGVAELDVDDVTSYGPETVTLHSIMAGMYRYCVHDFLNLNLTQSSALANSQALVKIYLHDGREYAFDVPNAPGTLWTVFEIDGATGIISTVNKMSYHSDVETVGM